MSNGGAPIGDHEVERLVRARDNDAVLKYRLERIRSARANLLIFGFEGPDDKIVFSRWIMRVRENLLYEPFVCEGKKGVARLKRVANRDLSGLNEIVFFFVDRDFDDLQMFEDDHHLYMTDRYSVENYLVDPELLQEILRDEFPCHERPDIRDRIVQQFGVDYREFLRASAPVNARIYVARKLGIEIGSLSDVRLNHLASVELGNVGSVEKPPEEIVSFSREPTGEEARSLFEPFFQLEEPTRYRGKFAFLFLRRWLDLLATELKERTFGLFQDLETQSRPRLNEITLGSLAAKSPLPLGFRAFVLSI